MKILAAAKKHLFCLFTAVLLTIASGGLSIWLTSEYYNQASYHYDSVYYRQLSAQTYQGYLQDGAWSRFLHILHNDKDILDLALRLFIYPPALNHFYGHLFVLLPFLFIFYYLLLLYVSQRTGSFLLALTGGASFLIFRFGYDAFWGLAEYWKYNLVAILTGCSILAFLLSQRLNKKFWGFLSGLFLGLAALQHTASAVYAALIIAPLILYAIIPKEWRSRNTESFGAAILRLAAFLTPLVAIATFIAVFQWQVIYEYYFVKAYCYAPFFGNTIRFLRRGFYPGFSEINTAFYAYPYGCGLLAPIAIFILTIGLLPFLRHVRQQREDIFIGLWLIIALPLVIVLVRGYYFGFYAFLTIFAVIAFCTVLPKSPRYLNAKTLSKILLPIILILAALQIHLTRQINNTLAQKYKIDREFYLRLTTYIANDPAAQKYGVFFDEAGAPLFNYFQYDIQLPLARPLATIKFNSALMTALTTHKPKDDEISQLANSSMLSVAAGPGKLAWDYYCRRQNILQPAAEVKFYDYYFRLYYPNKTATEIVPRLLAKLEHWPGSLAIGYYDLDHIYQPQSDPLAAAVVMGISHRLQKDPHWIAVAKWSSASGQLILYRYSPAPLPKIVKWWAIR